jgi:hypothetical protein
MKRMTQFVAITVVLLLAGQSAVAETSCAEWFHSGGGHVPACCAAAGEATAIHLRTDCHKSMRLESMASDCIQGGCQMAAVRVGTQAITTAKSRVDTATALVAIAQPPVTPASVLTSWSVESASAPGPAKYLLFKAFRI